MGTARHSAETCVRLQWSLDHVEMAQGQQSAMAKPFSYADPVNRTVNLKLTQTHRINLVLTKLPRKFNVGNHGPFNKDVLEQVDIHMRKKEY